MLGSMQAAITGAMPSSVAGADTGSEFAPTLFTPMASFSHDRGNGSSNFVFPTTSSQDLLIGRLRTSFDSGSCRSESPESSRLPPRWQLTSADAGSQGSSSTQASPSSPGASAALSVGSSPITPRQKGPSPRKGTWDESTPAPVVDRTEADDPEEVTFESTARAIRVRELYHWCATVAVLLLLQFVSDTLQHGLSRVPQPSEWSVVLLLVYAAAAALCLRYRPGSRPYAAHALAVGSLLMTCQLTWHWGSHAAQFQARVFAPPAVAPALPSSSFLIYDLIFGQSGPDCLDTATCLVVFFQNCVQSGFLCRLGLRGTAVVGVLQWLAIACWPLVSAQSNSSWFCRVGGMGLWTALLIRSGYVWEAELRQQFDRMDRLRRAAARSRQELRDGQSADSVLNHGLKNAMADAQGCIDLFRSPPEDEADPVFLSKASDILFRGMWWCKLREAILEVVAGRYEGRQEVVDARQFTDDLVRGREVTAECPSRALRLDPMACSVVLDNALTNGRRHGAPDGPQVHLRVDVVEGARDDPAPGAAAHRVVAVAAAGGDADPSCAAPDSARGPGAATPVEVRFLVRNRAHPNRPLPKPWSSRQPPEALPHDPSRPALSDGLGLQHIRLVANACGMRARLWQDDDHVCFEMCLSTTAAAAAASPAPPPPGPCPFRDGLHILALDDSGVTRQGLEMKLRKAIPNAEVAVFGKDPADVEAFKEAALAKGDILILDENVDLPGVPLSGSAILRELRALGYDGFACIRSGDPPDAAKAAGSGAQWHVSKDVWMRDMIAQLRVEYRKFKGKAVEEAAV